MVRDARELPEDRDEDVLRVCLYAARLLLRYGGETSRVEDTIFHMAIGAGAIPGSVESFVTPTGIFVSMTTPRGTITKLDRAKGGTTLDLGKVTEVNMVSRRVSSRELTLDDALAALQRIECARPLYPRWLLRVGAAVSSGSFTVVIGGGWKEFLSGAISGLLAQLITEWLAPYAPRFFSVLFAAIGGTLLAQGADLLMASRHGGAALIGAVLPLLPGLAVTNSIRDLLAGDLLSGVARGAEALLTAGAIAVAVAVAIGLAPKLG